MTSAAYRPRATWMRHLVLAALCAVTAINYIQRNSLGGVVTPVGNALHIPDTQIGVAISVFFLVYALGQIPSGWLAQKLTPRWALVLYAVGWSLATALCAAASSAATLIGARVLMGALQAGIFPCATMILVVWYPSKRRALATAILNSFMLIGGAVGSILTGLLLKPVGWRGLFLLYAAPGLLWALWFAWWFRNRPRQHPGVNEAELALLDGAAPPLPSLQEPPRGRPAIPADERHGIVPADEAAQAIVAAPALPVKVTAETTTRDVRAATPLLAIFLSWPLFLICVQQFCRAGANRFFDTWFVTFLHQARGVPVAEANLLASWPQWAGVVGGVVGGWVSDTVLSATGSRRAGRKGVAIASLLVCCLCYAAAYKMPNVFAAVALASMGLFIATFAAPCAYALTMDMGGRNLGVVFGTMNMVGNFGAMAFTGLSPWLKEWSGSWTLPLLVFTGMHLVAALSWLLLNPEGLIGESARNRNC